MTLKSDSKVCGMHKKSRMELVCAIMTVGSESQVCGMHKKNRIELGCTIMTVEKEARYVEVTRRAESRLHAKK